MALDYEIGSNEFMSDLNGIDAFINEEVQSQEGGDVWEEPYQVLPDSSEMDEVMDQENDEKAVDTYDQFVGTEVCIPDELGRKTTSRVTKCVKENEGNPRWSEHPTLYAD